MPQWIFLLQQLFLQKYFYSSSFESNYFSKEGPTNKPVLQVFFIFALSFEAPSRRPCYCRHSLVFEQCTKMLSFQHASLYVIVGYHNCIGDYEVDGNP